MAAIAIGTGKLADPVAAQNHYRDDGRWGAFEIKLSERQVEDAAINLKRFAEQRHHGCWVMVSRRGSHNGRQQRRDRHRP